MSEDNKKDLTFAEIIDKINEQLQISDGSISKPTIDELNQFQKTWFYHNWDVRFRKLASFSALGTRGAIAIPNTTFEEWLYWFHEWATHFADDYNEFKKLVYQAIKLSLIPIYAPTRLLSTSYEVLLSKKKTKTNTVSFQLYT